MRSFHAGSRRASHVAGTSAESTAAVLYMKPSGVRNVPYQRPERVLGRRGQGGRRGGLEGLQQVLVGRLHEERLRRAPPDRRLRVGALGPDALVGLLAAHVEPLHVDLGVGRLEGLLGRREQLLSVGRVDEQARAAVAVAAGEDDEGEGEGGERTGHTGRGGWASLTRRSRS